MTSLGIGRPPLRQVAPLFAAFVLGASASTSAEQIRVLLVMPTDSGRLVRQVSRFENALGRSTGRVVRAQSLVDADVIVQFTAYRRLVSNEGKSQDWWYGQYTLLKPPQEGTGGHRSVKPFAFVVGDSEDWLMEPALNLLEATLARALGMAPYSAKGKAL